MGRGHGLKTLTIWVNSHKDIQHQRSEKPNLALRQSPEQLAGVGKGMGGTPTHSATTCSSSQALSRWDEGPVPGASAPRVAGMLPSFLLPCGTEASPGGEQQQEAQAVQ